MTTLLMLWAFAACKLVIVPTAVTLPSQAQFQFRTKVQPVATCSQAVTCQTTKGTVAKIENSCVLVAPRVRKTTVVTVTATAESGQKASARVTVEGEKP